MEQKPNPPTTRGSCERNTMLLIVGQEWDRQGQGAGLRNSEAPYPCHKRQGGALSQMRALARLKYNLQDCSNPINYSTAEKL